MRFFLVAIQLAVLTSGFLCPAQYQSLQSYEGRANGPGLNLVIHVLSSVGPNEAESYRQLLRASINRRWYEEVPESALKGATGRVAIRFTVLNDGSLASPDPVIESSSGRKSFEGAALDGIKNAAPFKPFPAELKVSSIEIRATFFYNEKPEM
jgi:TonB family protein